MSIQKHQVERGHEEVEILSKKIGLSVGETRQVLKGIKELNDFWHWDKADEYLDYLEEVERECKQRLMEKNGQVAIIGDGTVKVEVASQSEKDATKWKQ